MKQATNLADIQKELRTKSDSDRAISAQRYFKTGPGEYAEGDQFIGLTVPDLRLASKKYRDISLNLSTQLLKSKIHEERLLALLIWVDQFKRGSPALKKQIFDLYLTHLQFINNWDLVDSSAHQIVGSHVRNAGDHRLLDRMAKSEWLWERRVAIIATYHFIQRSEFKNTLRLSQALLQDKHDLIHKAVGWMLREMGKRDLKPLLKFLDQYAAQMPRTMLRYSIEKLPEKQRLGYLKATSVRDP